jgi:hypothetical protein
MSYNENQYDSEAEATIDWYQHYMSVSIEDLAMEFMARKSSDESEVSEAMRMAVEARTEEAGDALMRDN